MQRLRERARSAGRGRGVRPPEPEIYFVSYPKSGRTWLRALLGKYLVLRHGLPEKDMLQTEWVTSAAGLPVSGFTHAGSEMHRETGLSDAGFDDPDRWRGRKVAFIARDIRDTLVSAYFQATRRICVFEGPISEFIRSERYGAKRIVNFYAAWNRNAQVLKEFLALQYEQLHADPQRVLRRVLGFMGESSIDDRLLQASVEYCSFDNLRRAEREDRFGTGILRPRSADDPESYKLREGRIGGHVRHLTPADVRYIDEVLLSAGLPDEGLASALAATQRASQ